MLVMGLLWVVLVVVALFFRPAVYGIFVLGSIVTFTGRRMFLRVAREEGTGTWLACLFVPFYSIFYFFTHLDETIRPFLIGFFGYVLLTSGMIVWFFGALTNQLPVNEHGQERLADDEEGDKASSPAERDYSRLAKAFGQALVKGDYKTAHSLGSKDFQTRTSVDQLAEAEDKSFKEFGKPVKIADAEKPNTDANDLAGPNHTVAGESPVDAGIRKLSARRAVGDLPDTVPVESRKASIQMEVQRDPRTIPDFEKKSGMKIEELTPDDAPASYMTVVLVKDNDRLAVAHYFHRWRNILD